MAASILIVEGDILLSKGLARSLTRMGYRIVGSATSGEEALVKTEELQPDLILMDIVLAGKISGIETADKIRTKFAVPVVYLTPYLDEDLVEAAKITEPYGYVTKPLAEQALKIVIDMALHKHKMESKLRESEKGFRLLYENAPLAYQSLDENGRLVDVNRAWLDLLGFSRDEVVGRWFGDFLAPGHVDRFKRGFESFKQSGELNSCELATKKIGTA
ncbi:response regulator [Thermodesulfobacteriota bacterium]